MKPKNSEKVTVLIDSVPLMGHCKDGNRKAWLTVIFYKPLQKEIKLWPSEVRKDLGSVITKLQKGQSVGEAETKIVKSLGPGCFEIRLKSMDGIYRVFYILQTDLGILIFHGFKKKTQKTPLNEIETGIRRKNLMLKELKNEKK